MTPDKFARALMKLTARACAGGLSPGHAVGLCIGFGAGLGHSLGASREEMVAQLDEGLLGARETDEGEASGRVS